MISFLTCPPEIGPCLEQVKTAPIHITQQIKKLVPWVLEVFILGCCGAERDKSYLSSRSSQEHSPVIARA